MTIPKMSLLFSSWSKVEDARFKSPLRIEIFWRVPTCLVKTCPGFPALEYKIASFNEKLALKEAILYSQSRKSRKCFTNK